MRRLLLVRRVLGCRYYSLKSRKSASSFLAEVSKEDFLAPSEHQKPDIHPKSPVRTRFAPSPTGFLHIGSLRTALFNYLLAKATGGQFILRIEDTDQSRKKVGTEENIYDSLEWAGIHWDEGPTNGGPYGPYRQSERLEIYRKHADALITFGHAYRCFCSKERLDKLRTTAREMTPPSMASYDRHCYHLSTEAANELAASGKEHTIRLKSPVNYPRVVDLLHGDLDLQIQVNYADARYDDPVLMKSDGYPTYHLANVVDDHAMKITHVIRGEEWLPSTPKHLALYDAFGWKAPEFIHIPLLTSLEDKKLSKRSGDIGVSEYMKSGILPEALVNFVALFGWYPPAETARPSGTTDIFSMDELISKFNLNGLTKGNVKVSESKLDFMNSHYFKSAIKVPKKLDLFAKELQPLFIERYGKVARGPTKKFELDYIKRVIQLLHGRVSRIYDIVPEASYIYNEMPDWGNKHAIRYIEHLSINNEGDATIKILEDFVGWWNSKDEDWNSDETEGYLREVSKESGNSSSIVFRTMRFAITASVPGAPLAELITMLDKDNVTWRAVGALRILKL